MLEVVPGGGSSCRCWCCCPWGASSLRCFRWFVRVEGKARSTTKPPCPCPLLLIHVVSPCLRELLGPFVRVGQISEINQKSLTIVPMCCRQGSDLALSLALAGCDESQIFVTWQKANGESLFLEFFWLYYSSFGFFHVVWSGGTHVLY